MNAGQWPLGGASLVQAIVVASGIGRQELATKTGLAQLEGRLKAQFAAAINKMLLGQLAVAGLLFAALKFF